MNESHFGQVDVRPSIHLAFEGLEAVNLPYGYSHGLRSLSGDPAPMTVDEGATHAKLLAEYRALEEEYARQDEISDEIDTRLGVLEADMEVIETRPLIFDPTEIGRAGRLSRSTATARSQSIAATTT